MRPAVLALLGALVLVSAGVILWQLHAASTPRAVSTTEGAPPLPALAPDRGTPLPIPPPASGLAQPRGFAGDPQAAEGTAHQAVPSVPNVALGESRLANPRFAADPQLRKRITEPEALASAEHGRTPLERANAVHWLMGQGGPETYPTLAHVRDHDPDQSVRTAAQLAVGILRSRFPTQVGR